MADTFINLYYELAKNINNNGSQYLYCMHDDKFYHYNGGRWEALFEVDFMGRIEESNEKLLSYPIPARKQIVENFKHIARKPMDIFNKYDGYINLKNGMLDVEFKVLHPHKPEFFSTNQLPYEYNPNAKCELWLKTLLEIMENDQNKINILQEFFGLCLTKEIKHHKALLLIGESRSGKSTILHTMRHAIGVQNCSSVPLKLIDNAQHTPMLINKLVNIDTDVSSKAAEYEAQFKTITTGEPVQTNQKYVIAFEFIPYCKLVMAANIFPKITDHSSAFYKRLIVIPCDRVFSYEEQNRDLPRLLMEELPGILNWSIEGLLRLNARGKFEEFDFMRDALEELENENNPVNVFFNDYMLVEMDSYIEKGELYEYYKTWCEKTKNYTLSSARFSSCVFKKFHKNTPKTARIAENGKRIWKNIRYSSDKASEIKWQE